MIRIDALWLCSQPQDMHAGADRLLAVGGHCCAVGSEWHGQGTHQAGIATAINELPAAPTDRLTDLTGGA